MIIRISSFLTQKTLESNCSELIHIAAQRSTLTNPFCTLHFIFFFEIQIFFPPSVHVSALSCKIFNDLCFSWSCSWWLKLKNFFIPTSEKLKLHLNKAKEEFIWFFLSICSSFVLRRRPTNFFRPNSNANKRGVEHSARIFWHFSH